MATQNQNPNAENQNENQQNKNFIQGKPGSESVQSESVQSGKKGLEQNDHTYEGENDVTHSPQKTGQPQNESSASNSQKQAETEASKSTQAGYNQSEHDATPEANAKNTNASDPRESKEPGKGSL